jgi:hypothetical protein
MQGAARRTELGERTKRLAPLGAAAATAGAAAAAPPAEKRLTRFLLAKLVPAESLKKYRKIYPKRPDVDAIRKAAYVKI